MQYVPVVEKHYTQAIYRNIASFVKTVTDRTKAAAIVNDFFADMNPSLWNGSTSMPKSFDDRAWQYPLADDVNLEITFVYNEEDGWCHYCDLVYQSDDSSFDMLSGYGIDSILNVTDTVMDLCRDY